MKEHDASLKWDKTGGQETLSSLDPDLSRRIRKALVDRSDLALENLQWLYAHMHPYFFITMKEETDAIIHLATRLHDVATQKQITLVDEERKLILARLDIPGSVYETLKSLREREISYAEMTHSYDAIPGVGKDLEVLRFEFERVSHEEVTRGGRGGVPVSIRKAIIQSMRGLYPQFDFGDFDNSLNLLWINNDAYVRISPPERIARVMWVYQQGRRHNGLYLDVETKTDEVGIEESRIMFSVGNPPLRGILTQVSEIFQRLDLGLRRSYSLIISTGLHPYFLGNFYVVRRDGGLIEKGSDLFSRLKTELYNTQILSLSSTAYNTFLMNQVMTGEEASLTNAFIAFCHTVLGHNQPDRFDAGTVIDAFHSDPDMTLRLITVFKNRFAPDLPDRNAYEQSLKETKESIESYNTGHRYLDEIRKIIFRTALSFIRNTVKTNFFVPEKHALAFRLDPAFLAELEPEFVSDLPQIRPFRVTFFFTRYGIGYHVGFSDIARGGWRTVICRTSDELLTNTYTLFREVFVLAHTQHLKNKDIYEGGSKLTVLVDTVALDSSALVTQRLYKVQYGVINAFLDLFVTEKGKAKNPRVVDYYGEDEPIELGPDENMHDSMIELIAKQSVKRGYVLGIGIMSSKHIGINHKEYGVTSRGVVKFAEIAMRHKGLDIYRDPFTVKFTGGPNGDVAGNSMGLLLERCPQVRILSIVDGTAAVFDPEGIDRVALGKLVLRHDLDHFDPRDLHPGGCMLFREQRRKIGLRELFRKVLKKGPDAEEHWLSADDFLREIEDLIFTVPSELFMPCGGRPETIDRSNWHRLFKDGQPPSASVIVEGANSFITPEARTEIQKRGVVVLRDASANKCGVISSSYEIIANLLLSEKEFLANKEAYVQDVIRILEKRAQEEAELIFKRYNESNRKDVFTDISNAISMEINGHYTRLFDFFQANPKISSRPLFRKVLLKHLPDFISRNDKYRRRVKGLPPKIIYAVLASEIASTIVYQGGWEMDFETTLMGYLKERFH